MKAARTFKSSSKQMTQSTHLQLIAVDAMLARVVQEKDAHSILRCKLGDQRKRPLGESRSRHPSWFVPVVVHANLRMSNFFGKHRGLLRRRWRLGQESWSLWRCRLVQASHAPWPSWCLPSGLWPGCELAATSKTKQSRLG